jgi:hypothetical protein
VTEEKKVRHRKNGGGSQSGSISGLLGLDIKGAAAAAAKTQTSKDPKFFKCLKISSQKGSLAEREKYNMEKQTIHGKQAFL